MKLVRQRHYRLGSIIVLVLGSLLPLAGYLAAQESPSPDAAAANRSMTATPGERLATDQGFGAVGVESLDDLKSLVLEGPREQVESLMALIEAIDAMSLGAEPSIEVLTLSHADAESLAKLMTRIYEAKGQAAGQAGNRRGTAGFIPMAQPNALVIVAQQLDLAPIVSFAKELDAESGRSGAQFRSFGLKNANAQLVRQKLQEFFAQRDDAAGLRVRVEVVADERTNSVLVFAGPTDLAQAEQVIRQLDSEKSESVSDLRIFRLKNAVASELATILQQAIVTRGLAASGLGAQGAAGGFGQQGQVGGGIGQLGAQAGLGQGAAGQQRGLLGATKSGKLRFLSTDRDGGLIESGILEDITINADDRSNSLIVTAPPNSMELVAELIEKLDSLPNPAAELKVFTLRNSDAEAMAVTLQSIFQTTAGQGVAGAQGNALQTVAFAVGDQPVELSRVGLNFSTDLRTNSVIVSGAKGDLLAVEAMILKLDASNARERQTIVYRLRNLTAAEASIALNEFLASQDVIAEGQEGRISFAEQISREVSIVPEEISNSLLISSTPRFFDEILRIVEEIDMRPAQVVIQVLIAEVQLNDDEELGLELGTQSSVLYDRSLRVRNSGAVEDSLNPGYNFNTTNPLQSPAGSPASEIGLQGLTNFALSRASSTLGYGGLIFTASSDNVSILLRALKRQRRLDVLSRPQIMTLDNQQAFIQIGQQVPTVTASQTTVQGSVVNSVEFRDVGIILQVTPRISPDGVVVMRVDPTVSSLDPSGGIPISSGGDNAPVLAPIINTTRAQTTVSAADSQTVVIGGLISRTKQFEERKLPIIGDWPVVGWAFKTRFQSAFKRELLIILTPHVVRNECEAEYIKQMEAKRIDWILKDVEAVHGDVGLPETIDEKYPSGHTITIEEEMGMSNESFLPSGVPYHEGMIVEEAPAATVVTPESEPLVPVEVPKSSTAPTETRPPEQTSPTPNPDYGPPPLPLDEIQSKEGKKDTSGAAIPADAIPRAERSNKVNDIAPAESEAAIGMNQMLADIAVKNSAPKPVPKPPQSAGTPIHSTSSTATPDMPTAKKSTPFILLKKRKDPTPPQPTAPIQPKIIVPDNAATDSPPPAAVAKLASTHVADSVPPSMTREPVPPSLNTASTSAAPTQVVLQPVSASQEAAGNATVDVPLGKELKSNSTRVPNQKLSWLPKYRKDAKKE